jgi:hypothetical protein
VNAKQIMRFGAECECTTAISFAAPPRGRALPLHIVIHRELVWVGAKAQGVVLFLFQVDPVGDEVFVEDVAAQQERMIGLERFDRAAK